MKKQTLLNYALATVIVVMLFYIRTSAEFKSEKTDFNLLLPGVPECNYSGTSGFDAGRAIDASTAKTQSDSFEAFARSQGNTIFGGVISKAALDSLFCEGEFNGLAYRLGMDPSGKFASPNTIFVIVGGVKIDSQQNVTKQSNSFYTTNLWCPPSCLSFQ